MNLILHIVRKDLVRLRAWIAGWVAVLLVPLAVGAWFITHNPLADADWSLPSKISILTGLELLLGYLLTILVLQEDGVVGTTQFWLTRPVSRGRMLLAKATSALVIVGLIPVAVSLPWWLWCGFDVGQIVAAAGEMLLVLVIAMLPGALVAVLTDSLARALLWTVALAAVILFGGGAYLATIGENQLVVPWRLIATAALIMAELAAIVAVQFHVRRRGWWLALAAAVIVGTLGLEARSLWRHRNDFKEPRVHDAALVPDLRIQFHRAEADAAPQRVGFRPGAELLWRVHSQFLVTGLPKDRFAMGLASKQQWMWPGGPSAMRTEGFYFDGRGGRLQPLFGLKDAMVDDEVRRHWAEDFEKQTQRKLAPGEEFLSTGAWLPPSLVARMRKEPPAFAARLWWQIARPELRLEVPLAPGRWTTRHGHGVGIERIDRDPNFMLTMVATRPAFLMSLLRSLDEWRREFEPDLEQSWALLDRGRGVVTYMFGERNSDQPRVIVLNGVRIEWRKHFTAGPGKMRNGKWEHDPHWPAGTSLAVFTLHDEAVVSRDIKVERFELSR